MAFGIILLLSQLALLCKSAVVNTTPGNVQDDPLGELYGRERSPEELANLLEKLNWDAKTISSTHDSKTLKVVAPPGTNGKIDVHMKMYLNRIDGLDLEHGVFDCVGWLMMQWKDSRWEWTGKHDLPAIILPADMVWKPDILLFNDDSSDGHHTVIDGDIRAQIKKDGTIMYAEPLHVHSTCDGLHEEYHDGDQVTCHMLFGSWMFDARRLNPVIDGEGIVDSTQEHENNQWRVVSVNAEKEVRTFEGYGQYADIKFSVTLEFQGDH